MNRHRQSQLVRPFAVRHRRGAIYIVVLGISAILATLSISLLVLARQRDKELNAANDVNEASVIAQSAVEDVLTKIQGSTAWRTQYTNNVTTTQSAMGRGGFYFKFVDAVNGNLTTSNTATTRLYGYGHVNSAYRCYSVNIGAIQPLTCLKCDVDATSGASVSSGTWSGSGTVSCNGIFTTTTSSLGAINIEGSSLSLSLLCTGTGSQTSLATARTFPDTTHVFDTYKTAGTSVSSGSIGKVGSVITINRALWTPTNNPYGGGTNSSGIYVIDCQGASVTIEDSRIVGTLVFLNAGTVTVTNGCLWEPAILNYPALLVQGALTMSMTGSLSETGSTTVNFNPAAAPYPYNGGGSGGTSNTTTTDTWYSRFSGLAYCTGALTTSGNFMVKGVLLSGGAWTASGALAMYYDPIYYYEPPPGFGDPLHMMPISGSWKWETLP